MVQWCWFGTYDEAAENVSWDVIGAWDVFYDSIIVLDVELPLEDFAGTVVVQVQEVPMIRADGERNPAHKIV
jgi:hypothetical protein